MNRVPATGLWRYGSISTKPSDAYSVCASPIIGIVSSRIAR